MILCVSREGDKEADRERERERERVREMVMENKRIIASALFRL
jgi:hypothetical protein